MSDPCVAATSGIDEIPKLKFESLSQKVRDDEALRAKRIEAYKQTLWDRKLPIALATEKDEDWKAVLSDSVHISVAGTPIKLSEDEVYEVGAGTDMIREDAARVLVAAKLTYKKGIKPCFVFDSETTGLTFTTTCVRVSSDAAKALKVEFKVDPSFNPIQDPNRVPTIREIRFIFS